MELQISGLSKRYPNGTQALQDVSLSIPQGMFGLLGPNGAGKSTLMRTLATLQEADSGTARMDGIDVLRDKDQVRKVLGYLPQEFGLYPKVPAETLLSHFAALKESKIPTNVAMSYTRSCARPTCGTIATNRWEAIREA